MALFPPLESGIPFISTSSRRRIAGLRPTRTSRGVRSGRGTGSLSDYHLLNAPLLYDEPLSFEPSFEASLNNPQRRSTFHLKPDPNIDPYASTTPPSLSASDSVKKNRIEFIAELFIILLSTRADCLTLVPKTDDTATHPDEKLYEFKHTLPPISSLGYGEDLFSCMYKPQAARTTSCSPSGRYSRFWRMAIASLVLRSEIPAFRSATETFDFFYDFLYDLSSFGARGVPMTAVASRRAVWDIVQSYTASGWKKSKIDYLDGMDENEKRLFIYMAQVGAHFLIPKRPDTMQILETGTHSSIQGIVETPALDASFATSSGVHAVNSAKELKEIKYFLKQVDLGLFNPNLSEIKQHINRLPRALPMKEESSSILLR